VKERHDVQCVIFVPVMTQLKLYISNSLTPPALLCETR